MVLIAIKDSKIIAQKPSVFFAKNTDDVNDPVPRSVSLKIIFQNESGNDSSMQIITALPPLSDHLLSFFINEDRVYKENQNQNSSRKKTDEHEHPEQNP